MKHILLYFVVLVLVGCNSTESVSDNYPMEVLVFTKTAGYHHESIKEGVEALVNLGLDHDFVVDTTSDASIFHIDSLSEYHVVVFLNTSGDILNDEQKNHFIQYIQNGGGFVGVHAATDTEYNWEWYGNLVGGYFLSHPAIQPAQLVKANTKFPAIDFMPDTITRVDEWYDFKWLSPNIKPILYLNPDSYNGSVMDTTEHPIAWYQMYDGGRSFYTGLGHTKESYTSDTLFLEHLLKGILWAGGQQDQK